MRNQFACGREDDCGIKIHWRQFIRTAGPDRAEIHGKLFCCVIAWPGEGVDFALLVFGHLRDDMRGGAETVDAEAFGVAGFDQTSITDQSRAQQRRDFGVAVKIWNWETKSLIGDGVFRIAAVKCVADEFCFVAEILLAVLTLRAFGAGRSEPRHTDSVADLEAVDVIA